MIFLTRLCGTSVISERRPAMVRRAALVLFACLLPLMSGADPATSRPEKWADPRLKVTDGLSLWLDAGRQQAARTAHQKPALPDGGRVDIWYDASGNGLNLVQRFQPSQPQYVPAGERAVVRFDGQDDWLGLSGLNRRLDAFSVFLVTAPRSNAGGFRAFLAVNATGQNDYRTGFNIDLTGEASQQFDRLNVEGKGFGGARSLTTTRYPFGEFHTVAVFGKPPASGAASPGRVQLALDGEAALQRNWEAGSLAFDDITLGARFYSNTDDPPFVSGFLDGDIAEVLLYDRVLNDEEFKAVSGYLKEKYAGLSKAIAGREARDGHRPRSLADPPPVQMFVPGFTVKELPVNLTNINNVRYRADGKLVALAYDGNIYLLSGSNGGLEDRVERFWENKGELRAPIGMALTPPGYPLGEGVFVACKGKLSLIVDTKHTGKADQEVIVASGWKELEHGVDALGVAVDKEGNLYFGLGAADFTNPYQIDKDGQAHYDLKSERGTILKVSPDFHKREIVCTGIRFPVGLAFNRDGALFATDQEGATWLPNGNPLDELLHIQPGRHYGFPPRHPRHLPGVIDEPSVFDYGPQHQSTCGLFFNDPVNGGPVFGPDWWDGNALLSGYSRGKLYRTELVRTADGYIARNNLLACLNMLTVDSCVSPTGDLVVSAHSGKPDWGSGPTGKGKLYKIIYSDRQYPQPVLAWAAGPSEVRVAFDRPLDPQRLKDLTKTVTIEYGRYVRPGDRFESLRPGYAVVGMQMSTPRFDLPVLGAQVTGDRRTLVIETASHPEAVSYALTLPGLGRPDKPNLAAGELPQVPAIDLGYDLGGVTASWQERDGGTGRTQWLPHLDLTVARALTRGSAGHDEWWELLRRPGKLTLKSQLDLWQMLRPAVQPGSSLDYTLPPEEVTLDIRADRALGVRSAAGVVEQVSGSEIRLKVRPKEGEPVAVVIELTTTVRLPGLSVTYSTNEDDRPRALSLGRVLLPWATLRREEAAVAKPVPELEGGSWARGRQVFFSEQASCSRCHQVGGEGGSIGPDLSNLVHRDYDSVLRDIREPSAAINPDFITYQAELADGRMLVGVVRTEGDQYVIGDSAGKEYKVRKGIVETMTPLSLSTMPEGLDKTLGPEKMRDLLTFLLTEPLKEAPPEREGAPPPRRRSEVEAVLKALPPSQASRRPLHIVLAAGTKDHGPGEHDYPLWQRRWINLLGLDENVRVSEATGWPSPKQLETADLVVFYSSNPGWSADRAKELDTYLERGGGLVLLHYAVNGRDAAEALAQRIGLAWKDGSSRFRHGPLDLSFPDTKNPITLGFSKVHFEDESYWKLLGAPDNIHVLATGEEEGAAQPLLWTREQGKGRVFVCILGHYTWTFDDPLFRILLLRGMAWSAGEPVDRFHSLVYPGARVRD
jgi:putative heme-binding domain-containing protein